MKTIPHKAWLFLLLLLFTTTTMKIHAQVRTPANAPQTSDNFFYQRDLYLQKLEAREKTEHHGKKEKEQESEDLYEAEFEHWEFYWRDRMDANSHIPGKMADVGSYMRPYNAQRGSGGDPSVQSNPAVCNSGLGNWTSFGPATYTNPFMGKVNTSFVNPSTTTEMYAGSGGGGLFKTTNNGASWTNLTDNSRFPCDAINSIAVDYQTSPTTLYVATGSPAPSIWGLQAAENQNVMRSTDAGVTWTEFLDFSTMSGLVGFDYARVVKIHPQDHNTVYVLAGQAVFKTSNATSATPTWTMVMQVPTYCTFGVFETTDIEIIPGSSGVSNSTVIVSTNRVDFDGSSGSSCGTARAYVSTNGGTSFTDITTTLLGSFITDRIALSLQPGNTSDVFYAYTDCTGNVGGPATLYVKKYTITGGTVTSIGSMANTSIPSGANAALGAGYWDLEFEFSKLNANYFYIGGQVVYKFNISSGGFTYVQYSDYQANSGKNTHADVRGLTTATSSTNDLVLISDDGGVQTLVVVPTDMTTRPTWTNRNGPGLNITQVFGLTGAETNYNELVIGTQDNGFMEYTSTLSPQWNNRNPICDGYRGVMNTTVSPLKYYGFSNGLAMTLTADGSGSYTTTGGPGAVGNLPIVSVQNTPTTLYTCFVNSGIYKLYSSTNFGTSWTADPTFPANGTNIRAIRVAPSNPDVIYVIKGGPTWGASPADKLYLTTNATSGSPTWTDISNVGGLGAYGFNWAEATDIVIDPNNPGRVWMSFNNYWGTPTSGSCRVFYSANYGSSWTDITANMLAFPVNCLAYQQGSADAVYAGTDIGVFRYNSSTGQWDCFNNGLPVVAVMQLEINNCKKKIRAATYGRGVYESDLPATSDYVVNTTTTWAGTRYLTNDLFVTGGATLTITGTLNMSVNNRIKVDRGATLIINGGKITNCCGNMWQGIEVWGTSTSQQTVTSAQGKLVMQNNATIENALEGVALVKMNGLTPDLTYTGGIVQAINSFFYNNRRDVAFYSYHWYIGAVQKSNLSYFKNCKFETNKQLNDPSQLLNTHITVNDVYNPTIVGNQFNNTTSTSIYSVNLRGGGVTSFDGVYTVDDYLNTVIMPPTVISASKFLGLTTGVQADFTSGAAKSVFVKNSDFDNVQKGIQISNSLSAAATTNIFINVPLAQTTNFTDATWAIRFNNSNTLTVLSNSVTGASASYQNNYGTIIDNCGSSNNQVTWNTYRDLYVGVQAQGNNGSGTSGVQIKCNTFLQAMRYQIVVNPQTSGSIADQGSACTTGSTCANTFYVSSTPSSNQVYSPINTFNYYASGVIPTYYTGITVTSCSGVTDECTPPCQNCARMSAVSYEDPQVLAGIIADLEQQHSTEANIILTGTYIESGDYVKAQALINSFKHDENLKDVADYFTLQLSLSQAGKRWYDLDGTQTDRIREIADGKSGVAYSAQAVMGLVKGITYEHPVERILSQEETTNPADGSSVLSDNIPNPFSSTTIIQCKVDKQVQKAELVITSSTGVVMQILPLVSGENTVTVESNTLENGVYYYSLVTDGKRIATKKMVLIRR